jgi:EAL domain-containing protein (putative c-di-GMP-specific phosphodiesterase class I)
VPLDDHDGAARATELVLDLCGEDAKLHRSDAAHRGSRVLLVGGEPRSASRAILDDAGYDTRTIEAAAEAFEVIAARDLDAVVIDLSSAEGDGMELLRRVRRHDPSLPVVLMTDAPSLELARHAVDLGANQFLLKPFSATRLTGAIGLALAKTTTPAQRKHFVDSDHAQFDRMLSSLWMAFQPIVEPSGVLYAYEALVRSDESGLSSAGEIVDAAERLERLPDLGRRVRAQAGGKRQTAGADWTLFVNLHAHDLMDDTLLSPDAPLTAIARHVVLEITERAALHDVGEARARMAELRRMGFRLALDDLGAGYAGLTSFALLEPDIVKLDMGLVRGIDADRSRQKLIGAIVALSHDHGIRVVGEGVETQAEREMLVELGCDLLQGYLFGRPERL